MTPFTSTFPTFKLFILASIFLVFSYRAESHDGPDPVAYWQFESPSIDSENGVVKARLGADAFLLDQEGKRVRASIGLGKLGAILGDQNGGLEVPHSEPLENSSWLPAREFTVAAWVSIEEREQWGGIVGAIQDNGNNESGWLLGYDETSFYFALRGAEGPGRLTYLRGKTPYQLGKAYHVSAVYDGASMQLYVNGKLDVESDEQSGDIAYPQQAYVMLGAYRDTDEHQTLRGQLRSVKLFDVAAKPLWVEHDFEHDRQLTELPAASTGRLRFVVEPYLQFATQTQITVMWRASRPAKAIVAFGETAECESRVTWEEESSIGEVRLPGLKPQTQYFYKVSLLDDSPNANANESLASPLGTFQTAVLEATPFAFAVISDTQGNPSVSGQLAEHAWGQRPSFLLHPGDLVDAGPNDRQWTDHFFQSMKGLLRHVPFYPVLGNHEQNASNYFDYVSLPAPEYFYTFTFGNTQFFMIDSNRKVSVDSEQYKWLDRSLSESKAKWKIVSHHHPPYSSDENDYGDLWKTNRSSRGDVRIRELVPLMESRGVDLVWNGHIHSYERTWPIRKDAAAEHGSPIYMITGGGGGPLETAGPIRPFFTNTVRHGHHYCMVRVNGGTMEIQAYDLENRLFDQLVIRKAGD